MPKSKMVKPLAERLVKAAMARDTLQVQKLLDSGANPNELSKDKSSALMEAAAGGNDKLVTLLLRRGADPNLKGKYRNTALCFAAVNGYPKCVRLLIRAGANPNCTFTFHVNLPLTLLTAVAGRGHCQVITELVVAGADIHGEKSGRIPLEMAALGGPTGGHLDAVKLLIELGADVNRPTAEGGLTPLITASKKGLCPIVKYLLDHGANIDAQDAGGLTALMWAACLGKTDAVAILIAAGADLEIRGDPLMGWNKTALLFAVDREREPIVRLLLKAGAKMTKEEQQSVREFFGGKLPR